MARIWLQNHQGNSIGQVWLVAALPLVALTPLTPVSFIQAIVLGTVQGLTEFLPISSTGHLIVVSRALGWTDPSVGLSAVLELGSIFAVVVYLRQDWTQILQGSIQALRQGERQSPELRLAIGIGLGTLPIVIFGLLIKRLIPDFEHSAFRSLTTIGTASIGMGLLLALAEWLGRRQRGFAKLQLQDGLGMGLAQALAIVPGISRSGSTLTAGLFLGLDRATAARFSFLLAIPAIGLTGLVELIDLLQTGLLATDLLPLLVGGATSAIVSFGAIGWLLNYLQTHSTWIFVWYRLAFGLVLLAGLAAGRF